MSRNYDNWERLVNAVLKREHLRFLARAESLESSSFSSSTSPSDDISIGISFNEGSSTSLSTPRPEPEILSCPNVKAFSFNELKSATRNFRPGSLLGEGRFGYVYKGWIDETTLMATKPGSGLGVVVKVLKHDPFHVHEEWLTKVNYFGKLCHPNLVKLIGYCTDSDYRLLVYQFMPKGSLENHLFRRRSQPLSWATRMKVATDAARGLNFLHEAEQSVISRCFKASNILLDSEFNAKLSDFGFTIDRPTEKNGAWGRRRGYGTGYDAPEYVITGQVTTKSDVYSFSVVLLELISGRRVVHETAVEVEETLVDWAIPWLGNNRLFFRVIDIRLEGQYPHKDAYIAATIALQCLSYSPERRPQMAEVLSMLEDIQSSKYINKQSKMSNT